MKVTITPKSIRRLAFHATLGYLEATLVFYTGLKLLVHFTEPSKKDEEVDE